MADRPDIRIAFFDLDGTLISFDTHEIVPSAKDALRLLRENGIHPIMATGRPHYLVDGVDWDDFDAFMTFNGNYCFTPDETIRSLALERSVVDAVIADAEAGKYPVMFQLADEAIMVGRNELVEKFESRMSKRIERGSLDRVRGRDVYQLNIYQLPEDDEPMLERIPNMELVRWTPLAADAIPLGSGKATGIRAMLDHYGLTPEQAIAFGDGGNDVSMFEVCGIGVAMGNAMEEAKAAADFVTDACDDDGVFNACRKLGLI